MPSDVVHNYGAPRTVFTVYNVTNRRVDVAVTLYDKTATRLPEAGWYTIVLNLDSQPYRHM
jgi:hypothetical protein